MKKSFDELLKMAEKYSVPTYRTVCGSLTFDSKNPAKFANALLKIKKGEIHHNHNNYFTIYIDIPHTEQEIRGFIFEKIQEKRHDRREYVKYRILTDMLGRNITFDELHKKNYDYRMGVK